MSKSKKKNSIKFILLITPVFFFLGVFIIAGWIYHLSKDLPSLEQLEKFEPNLSTRVYSSDGKIIREFFEHKRVLIPLKELPKHFIDAVLATEDKRFYHHWGVDIIRFVKVAMINLREMRYAQGFSSITQQLARNLYLTREKTIGRKIKEILTAVQIERVYSKNEILEMYLNSVPFGHRSFGIFEAAKTYFSKHPGALSLEESALLIAQLKGHTRYSPVRNPDLAFNRRNLILKNMFNLGYITLDEYTKAKGKPIKHTLNTTTAKESWGIAPYFTEYVRLELEKMQEDLNVDIYRDGLTIYTTLNTGLQKIAEEVSADQLKVLQNNVVKIYSKFEKIEDTDVTIYNLLTDDEKIVDELTEEETIVPEFLELLQNETFRDSLIRSRSPVQTAFMCMDPKTGYILSMIGGRDIIESKYNRAVQASRQPGSSFKPFIYATAMEKGIPVTRQFLNQPINIPDENGEPWMPRNYDRSIGGLTTIRYGLTKSYNLVTARLLQEAVSPREAVRVAYRLGISTPLRPYASLALGTSEVYLKELVAAYCAFANEGVRPEPIAITRIEDRFGNVVYENRPRTNPVISKEVAYMVTSLLQSVVREGTGKLSHEAWGFKRPAAGKTGTTDDFRNAWFVGYTPQLVSGTWVGLDDLRFILGEGQSGAIAALPIWANFMKIAHDFLNLPETDFEKPPGIIDLDICEESKKLATPYCKKTYKEVFIRKYRPTEKCDIHTKESGY